MPLLLTYNQCNYSGWFPLRCTVAQPELTFLVRAVSAILQPLGLVFVLAAPPGKKEWGDGGVL